jgi:hypothetical protein
MSGLHAGDTTPALTGQATSAGVGVDLTSSVSVEVHVVRPDGTLITRAPVYAGTSGAWSLAWLAGELDLAGVYVTELEVTWPAGLQTFGPGSFRVHPQLDTGPAYVPPTDTILDGGTL